MKEVCPHLSDASNNVIITTDSKTATTNAIHNAFPNLPHFLCPLVLQDMKQWLTKHGLHNADEMSYNMDCVSDLRQSDSEAMYSSKFIPLLSKWSQPFSSYFTDHIHSNINRIGS